MMHGNTKLKCGEDVYQVGMSAVEVGIPQGVLQVLSPQFDASYFLCKFL
jgi:hypothetical protein